MKKKLFIICFPLALLLFISSFIEGPDYLLGKWNISAVGTADPKLIQKINTGKESYLPALSTMMADGDSYQFKEEGKYAVVDKDGKEIVSGDYTVSRDGETLTLITAGEDVEYKIKKTSDKHIKLVSKKDASTFELSKKM